MKIDFLFLEFYIKKKYDQSVEQYFNITKQSVSAWRTSNEVSDKRLFEFCSREGSIDIEKLFKNIYE
jgi:hypothetical protein